MHNAGIDGTRHWNILNISRCWACFNPIDRLRFSDGRVVPLTYAFYAVSYVTAVEVVPEVVETEKHPRRRKYLLMLLHGPR